MDSAVAPRPRRRLHPPPPRLPLPGPALALPARHWPRAPGLAALPAVPPLAEEPGHLGDPGTRPGARARSPRFPQSTVTPRRRRTLPPQPRPRPFPAAGTGSARRVPPRPQPPRGPGGPSQGGFPPRPRAEAPTPRTGEEAAPRARGESGRGLGGKARCSFSSPRGPPTSLWSGEGAGPNRGARTGWGAPRPGSASHPSSASSPSPEFPLGKSGWVGGDSRRVAESQSLQPGCGADGRARCPGGGGGGEEKTPSLPETSGGSDPRGQGTDKFLHLGCLKRPRPWRPLSPPHQGAQHHPGGLKRQYLGPLRGFQLPRQRAWGQSLHPSSHLPPLLPQAPVPDP